MNIAWLGYEIGVTLYPCGQLSIHASVTPMAGIYVLRSEGSKYLLIITKSAYEKDFVEKKCVTVNSIVQTEGHLRCTITHKTVSCVSPF